MASGRQRAEQNVVTFDAWVATQSDEDFAQIIFQGKLSRVEVAKGVGCGKSALNQNPALRKRLKVLEEELRERGVLPALTEKAKALTGQPKEYDHKATRRALDTQRTSLLEQENIELKARVRELEAKLERFGELSEVLFETGMMPR